MARKFNGTSDVGNTAAIGAPSQKIALSFWLYWDSYANNDHLAVELSTNENTHSGSFFLDPNGSAFTAWTIAWNVGSTTVDVSFTRPSAAVWHHFVINFDASQSTIATQCPSVYVDGVAVTLTTHGVNKPAFNWGNYAIYFMSRGGSSLFGAGRMADFVMYSGINLSAAEAKALAQGISPNQIERPSMFLYLPFWGVSSTEADLSGKGHNCTMTGTTVTAPPGIGRYVPKKKTNMSSFTPPAALAAAVLMTILRRQYPQITSRNNRLTRGRWRKVNHRSNYTAWKNALPPPSPDTSTIPQRMTAIRSNKAMSNPVKRQRFVHGRATWRQALTQTKYSTWGRVKIGFVSIPQIMAAIRPRRFIVKRRKFIHREKFTDWSRVARGFATVPMFMAAIRPRRFIVKRRKALHKEKYTVWSRVKTGFATPAQIMATLRPRHFIVKRKTVLHKERFTNWFTSKRVQTAQRMVALRHAPRIIAKRKVSLKKQKPLIKPLNVFSPALAVVSERRLFRRIVPRRFTKHAFPWFRTLPAVSTRTVTTIAYITKRAFTTSITARKTTAYITERKTTDPLSTRTATTYLTKRSTNVKIEP